MERRVAQLFISSVEPRKKKKGSKKLKNIQLGWINSQRINNTKNKTKYWHRYEAETLSRVYKQAY